MNKIYLDQERYYEPINRICTKYRIPYVYDWTMSLHTNMDYLIKLMNGMVIEYGLLQDMIEEFIRMFDKDLQETIIKTLEKWQEEGKLEGIINEALFNQKLDKSEFEEYKNNQDIINKNNNEIINTLSKRTGTIISLSECGGIGDYDVNTKKGTDNTEAFKCAMNKLVEGGTLYIPKGNYLVSQAEANYIYVMGANVNIVGEGQGTRIYGAGFDINGYGGVTIKNMYIEPDHMYTCGVRGNSKEVTKDNYNNVVVKNLVINKCYDGVLFYKAGYNFTVENVRVRGAARIGITFDHVTDYVCSNCYVEKSKQGYHIEGSNRGYLFNNVSNQNGEKALWQVPSAEQPDNYRSSLLIANSKYTTVDGFKSYESNSARLEMSTINTSIINTEGLGRIGVYENHKNLSIRNNKDVGCWLEGSATLEGDIIIENNQGERINWEGVRGNIKTLLFKGNRSGRINAVSSSSGSSAFIDNNDIESKFASSFDFETVFINNLIYKSTSDSSLYPDYMGIRLDSSKVKYLSVNGLMIPKGSSSGNIIVEHNGNIESAYISNYKTFANTSIKIANKKTAVYE